MALLNIGANQKYEVLGIDLTGTTMGIPNWLGLGALGYLAYRLLRKKR